MQVMKNANGLVELLPTLMLKWENPRMVGAMTKEDDEDPTLLSQRYKLEEEMRLQEKVRLH